MTEFLSDYFGYPDEIIQEMAHRLADYAQQLAGGEITQPEYDDLVDDASTLQDVVRAGKTVAELALLDKVIETLKEIASAIPL